jgi:ABC-type glycerol-3-phosphate transport system permease component
MSDMSKRRITRVADRIVTHGVLGLMVAVSLFPIVWGVVTSIKLPGDLVSYPPRWIPTAVTIEHYREVFLNSNMTRYFLNSLLVSGLTILLTLTIGMHGGYAASRGRFRGKAALLFIILATIMIPGISVLVPLYMLAARLHLLNTYLVLVLIYTAWQVPTVLWFMRGFFDAIPPELEEAAQVDGCSRLQAFYRVVLPLTQPGLAASAILVFVYVWNEFIIALTMSTKDDMRLIPVGLYFYISQFGVEWGKLMAAVTVAILPIIVLFVILQRRFVQGLTSGAIKG